MARMAVQHAHRKAGSSAAEQCLGYDKETPCWHPGTNSSQHRLARRLRMMLLATVMGTFLLVAHLSHQQSAPGSPAEQQKLTAGKLAISTPSAAAHKRTGPQSAAKPTRSAEQDLATQDRAWFLGLASPHEPRHQLPDRGYVSQAPFVSGDTFRSMADWTFDDYTQPPGAAAWRPRDVKQGDIIFVKTDLLLRFFKERHTKSNATYILISSNSDYSAPADPRSPCKADRCAKYLADSQLGHWYGENMLPGYGSKTTPLPIGLASENWPHGDSRALLEVAQSAPAWEARRTSVYVAMKHRTNKQRKKVAEQMGSLPGALHVKNRVTYKTYLKQVANSKFVAAPPGNGMDTHRAWEAIYLGAVPIIQRGPLDWLYEGLPVLLVKDFDMVNTTLLERYAAERNATQRSTDRAWAVYWHRELRRMQRRLRSKTAA